MGSEATVSKSMGSEAMVNLDSLSQPSVVELARRGDLEAIAQWLNAYLMPQGVWARVATDRHRGLLILLEFDRLPDQERLVRFVCHRLYKLNSDTFGSVHILARFLGTSFVIWEQTVRLSGGRGQSRRSPERSRPRTPSSASWPAQMPGRSPMLNKPVLVGSALLAFVVGSGLNAVSHYILGGSMSGSGAKSTKPQAIANSSGSNSSAQDVRPANGIAASTPAPAVRTNKVQTALEEVAVLQQDVRDPANPIVTLMFSSDAMVETPQNETRQNETPQNTANKPITVLAETTGGIDPYLRADLAIASIDRPINRATAPEQQPAGAISSATLDHAGVDLVSVGAEQASRRSGLARTLQALDEAGINSIGAGENSRTARRPQIIEVRGQRIAYFGYSDDTLEVSQQSNEINSAVDAQVAADIHAIRDQVDWVVVNYHWGKELSEYPADWQVRMARYAVDQGADLVVGYHPDMLQGAEVYKGRAIAYSLGDFIFSDHATAKDNYNTAVLKVSLNDGQMKLEFLPVQVRQSKPSIVDSEKGRVILRYIQQASQVFEQPLISPMVLDARSPSLAPKPIDSAEKATSSDGLAPADSFIAYPDAEVDAEGNAATDTEAAADTEATDENTGEESANYSEDVEDSVDYSEDVQADNPVYADDYVDDEWSHDAPELSDEAGAAESDAEY